MKHWTKRAIALVLVTVMLVAMIPFGMISVSGLNYNKSEFSIANLADWNAIATYANENDASFEGKTIKLTANIDAKGATLPTLFNVFRGTFDGQGYTISNFNVNDVALIARATYGSAVIKNVNIDGTLSYSSNVVGVGMLVAVHNCVSSEDLTISNVSVGGSVTAASCHVGGLVGSLTLREGQSASITNVNVSANVTSTRRTTSFACVSTGGIIGVLEPLGRFDLTVRNANITGTLSTKCTTLGGVIGSVFSRDSTEDLYAGGTITISNVNTSATLSSSTWTTMVGTGGIVGSMGGFKRDYGEYASFDGELNVDNCVIGGSIENTCVYPEGYLRPSSCGGVLGSLSYAHTTVNVDHCLITASFPSNSLTATNGTGAGLVLGISSHQTMSALNVNNVVTTHSDAPVVGSALSLEMFSHSKVGMILNGTDIAQTVTPEYFVMTQLESGSWIESYWKYSKSVTDSSVLTVSSAVANEMVKKDTDGFIYRVGGQITALGVQDNVADNAKLTSSDKYAIRFIGISQLENVASASMTVIVRDAMSGIAYKRYIATCTLYDGLNAYDVNGARIGYYNAADFGAKKFLALTIGSIPGGEAYTFDFTPSYVTEDGLTVTAETVSITYDANGQYVKAMESFDVAPVVTDRSVRIISSNILNTDNVKYDLDGDGIRNEVTGEYLGGLSHEERMANMAEMLCFYHPDFIGLQEVFGHNVINGTATLNMQDTLLSLMGEQYAYVDFTSKVATSAHWTPIMYLKDQWKVLESDIQTDPCCSMHRWQWARFQSVEDPSYTIVVVNIHGPHGGAGHGDASKATFYAKLNTLLKSLEATYTTSAIAITGDYNASSTSDFLATMIEGTTIRNTYDLTSNHEKNRSDIDHIFLTKERATAVQLREVTNFVLQKSSDHATWFADILLKKGTSYTMGSTMDWNDGVIMGTKYQINSNTNEIKILGERYLSSTKTLYADWTASGLEFYANVSFTSDIIFTASSTAPCYFKAYVDGVLWKNGSSDYYTVSGATQIALNNVPSGTHTIRLVKATGYLLGQAEISAVELNGTISATPDQELYIEFLGDSISCGWGVVGDHDGGYKSQDGTLAYPYLVAQALNADYSILGLSGRGVVYGTDYNFDKNYLNASPARSTAAYGFERKADIVVINLGTNDRGNHADTAEFEAGYVRLLENVFAKNGSDCIVYCLWGAMNDAYNTQIQSAIATYRASHAGAQIHTLELTKSTVAGGAPSWGHPSISDHAGYTTVLTEALNKVIS